MIVQDKQLVDGKYSFRDLVDLNRLRVILERFSEATGFTTGLVSYPEQELLISTGWRDICTEFHRAFPASELHCKQSNLELTSQLKKREELNIRRCENGLVDGATPIIIRGVHVASLFTGQIFFEQPDFELFRKQGEKYGYDLEAYLSSVAEVPVVSENEFRKAMEFLWEMAVMLGEQGLKELRSREAQEELRKSEEMLRTLIETMNDAFGIQDENGVISYVNDRQCEMLGYSKEEFMGKLFLDFFDVDSRQIFLEQFAQRKQGKSGSYEVTLVHKDGERVNAIIAGTPIFDMYGHFKGSFGVATDVTHLKKVEAQQSAHLHFLESLDTIEGAIRSAHTLDEMMNNVLASAIEVFGCDRAWLMSPCDPEAQVTKIVMERTRPEYPGTFSAGQEVPVVHDLAEIFKATLNSQVPLLFHPDKGLPLPGFVKAFSIKSSITQALFLSTGKPWMLGLSQCSYAREWTEHDRRLFQEMCYRVSDSLNNLLLLTDLRESELRFRSTFEQAAVGICHVATDGRFLRVNRKLTDIFGYAKDELLGFTFQDITHHDDLEAALNLLQQVLDDEIKTYSMEKRYIRKDGSYFWANLTVSLSRDHLGSPQYFISVVEDITDRKNAERALIFEKEFTERALDAQRDTFFLIDPIARRAIRWNRTFNEITGYSDEEIAAMPAPDSYYSVDELDRAGAFIKEVLETGKGEIELELICKDGHKVPTEYSVALVEDASGSTRHLISIGRDITERKKVEKALSESERLYRSLVEVSPNAIFVHHRGICVFTNPAGVRLLGASRPDDLIGTPIKDVIHPDCREAVQQRISQSLSTGQYASKFDEVFVRLDGSAVDVEVMAVPVLFQGAHSMLVLVRDISESKKAQEALRSSEQRFRLAWDTSPDALSISRLDNGNYVDVNEGYTVLTGYPREEVIGRSALDLPFWAEAEDRKPFAEYLEQYGHVSNFQTRMRRKTGELRSILISAGLMMLSGEPHLLAVTKDIEDIKKAEEALKDSEKRYRTLFEESIDGVYSVLREGEITDANESFCKIFGYAKEEIIGKDIRELYSDSSDRLKFQERIEKSGFVKDYAIKLIRKDGKELDCLVTNSVYMGSDGSIAGYRGIVRDATDQQLLQRQLLQAQKMEAVGTLAGGIAHDVNNLLQVMLGQADLLLSRGGLDEKTTKSVEAIRQSALNGADLVRRVLAFSRETETQMQPVNLSDELLRIYKLLERTIPKMIQIEMNLQDNLWSISADPSQLEQVILNLAVNAKDAMPEGGRLGFETRNETLREEYCRLHPEVQPGKYVLMTVFDSGQGIEKQTLDRIFEPFFTTKQPGEGTGLGLSMVFGMVKSHGGHISCYSEVGVGTTFRVYFPVAKVDLPSAVADTMEVPVGGTETLLLVDDDNDVRMLGAEMLELAGYSLLTASDGREALDVYSEHKTRISLVILDFVMPKMSGRQCLDELLSMDPGARILIASGYSANGLTRDALERGAIGFISKPFDQKQILLAVRKALDASTETP